MKKHLCITLIITITLIAWPYLGLQAQEISGTLKSKPDGSLLNRASIGIKSTANITYSDANGHYSLKKLSPGIYDLEVKYRGYRDTILKAVFLAEGQKLVLDIALEPGAELKAAMMKADSTGHASGMLNEKANSSNTYTWYYGDGTYDKKGKKSDHKRVKKPGNSYTNSGAYNVTLKNTSTQSTSRSSKNVKKQDDYNTDGYAPLHENGWKSVSAEALSTFSIDVDNASYSNIRSYINEGQRPPKDAVRIEEMINYFTYKQPVPLGEDPFSINNEVSTCPWNPTHKLVMVNLQGKIIPTEDLPNSNLVFLVDVSGSMEEPNRLPLVQSSLKLLVKQLRPSDKVSIVVYAGNAGLVLPATAGSEKQVILDAIDRLRAGGSTAGGAGIKLAYLIASENFISGGNNRVILCTDGDFNVGASSDAEMERLIVEKRKEGVFLSVLGYGKGNYKDSKMELLADKGNGNYAYIDTKSEADKVLVKQFGGTMFTIAKDVKIQVEWNPAYVKGYRLIGYEDRVLANEDFNDDTKDAGELGSGHTVTALYEVIPASSEELIPIGKIDSLKYQPAKKAELVYNEEMMTVKFRYKKPDGNTSLLISKVLPTATRNFENASENLRWAGTVSAFGMLLRDSEYKGAANYEKVLGWAEKAKGTDAEGYRAEFIELVRKVSTPANIAGGHR